MTLPTAIIIYEMISHQRSVGVLGRRGLLTSEQRVLVEKLRPLSPAACEAGQDTAEIGNLKCNVRSGIE